MNCRKRPFVLVQDNFLALKRKLWQNQIFLTDKSHSQSAMGEEEKESDAVKFTHRSKKYPALRPFVLIEIFIAMSLLTLCAFPFISFSLRSFKQQKKLLFNLELERQAELLFYDVVKNSATLNWGKIGSKSVNDPEIDEARVFKVEGLGEISRYYHCHISQYSRIKEADRRVHYIRICLREEQGICKRNSFAYKFQLFVKKVDEKKANPHVKIEHEGLSQNIQAPGSSE